MSHRSIVVVVVFVLNGDTLSAFDVYELYGIIQLVEYAVGADTASQMGKVVASPTDGIAASAFLMLIAGDIDAVDAVGVVVHTLSAVLSSQPFTHAQML